MADGEQNGNNLFKKKSKGSFSSSVCNQFLQRGFGWGEEQKRGGGWREEEVDGVRVGRKRAPPLGAAVAQVCADGPTGRDGRNAVKTTSCT